MKATPIERWLCDYAMKMVVALGKKQGADLIQRNIAFWEKTYGAATANRARELILAEWKKRYGGRRKSAGSPVLGHGPNTGSGGGPEEQPDEGVVPA